MRVTRKTNTTAGFRAFDTPLGGRYNRWNRCLAINAIEQGLPSESAVPRKRGRLSIDVINDRSQHILVFVLKYLQISQSGVFTGTTSVVDLCNATHVILAFYSTKKERKHDRIKTRAPLGPRRINYALSAFLPHRARVRKGGAQKSRFLR